MNSPNDQIYIYPTDTVWGIGCSIYSEVGYQKIAEIKKTSTDKPLSIMFSSVDELLKSFNFPAHLTKKWLTTFFKLETTLGISTKASKIKIPSWATQGSEFVSLRCLETDVTEQIYTKLGAPFFTTSLNISGESPIVNTSEAISFQKKFAPGAKFINLSEGHSNFQLSGSSSTIIFINESGEFQIKREGKRIEDVREIIGEIRT